MFPIAFPAAIFTSAVGTIPIEAALIAKNRAPGLNRSFSDILTGIILFFIIGCEFFINYKVQFRSSGKKEA